MLRHKQLPERAQKQAQEKVIYWKYSTNLVIQSLKTVLSVKLTLRMYFEQFLTTFHEHIWNKKAKHNGQFISKEGGALLLGRGLLLG